MNTYVYVGGNPIHYRDIYGLDIDWDGPGSDWPSDTPPAPTRDKVSVIPFYGHWCGPYWTGGNIGKWDRVKKTGEWLPPVDELDGCCMQHDICHSDCRNRYPCQKKEQEICLTLCDRKLAGCSRQSPTWPFNWAHKKGLEAYMSRSYPKAENCECK